MPDQLVRITDLLDASKMKANKRTLQPLENAGFARSLPVSTLAKPKTNQRQHRKPFDDLQVVGKRDIEGIEQNTKK